MKLIGVLGGMSWESTVRYYEELNRGVRERLGGLHSARCLLYSVDFADVEPWQASGEWDRIAEYLSDAAQNLERGGAECLVLATNTMHKVHEQIQKAISIPLLHIADGTAAALKRSDIQTVGLLGTRYTMEQDFYKGRLERSGFEVVVPDAEDRAIVNSVIYDELCLGRVTQESRHEYERIVESLAKAGAQGVILGCTEIGMLIGQENSPIPVFDTTLLHVAAALEYAQQPQQASPTQV